MCERSVSIFWRDSSGGLLTMVVALGDGLRQHSIQFSRAKCFQEMAFVPGGSAADLVARMFQIKFQGPNVSAWFSTSRMRKIFVSLAAFIFSDLRHPGQQFQCESGSAPRTVVGSADTPAQRV